MKSLGLVIMVYCSSLHVDNADQFKLKFFSNSDTSSARCLDGSPPAYLLRRGNGDGASKWFISFEGGGWCHSHEDCYRRSGTLSGSSRSYVEYEVDSNNNYFSASNLTNFMSDWNMISLSYCDGGSFTGDATSQVNDTLLYYKGSKVLEAFIDELRTLGVNSATDMIISGISAGGLSSIVHIDLFREAFNSTFIVGLPDSGLFPAHEDKRCTHPYESSMKSTFEIMNSSHGANKNCINAGLGYKCLFGLNLLPYVETPLFLIQPVYDIWVIENIVCTDRYRDIQHIVSKFAFKFDFEVQRAMKLSKDRNRLHSVFLDSCPRHSHADINWSFGNDFWNSLVDSSGRTQQQLFRSWFETLRWHFFANQKCSASAPTSSGERGGVASAGSCEVSGIRPSLDEVVQKIHRQRPRGYPDRQACVPTVVRKGRRGYSSGGGGRVSSAKRPL